MTEFRITTLIITAFSIDDAYHYDIQHYDTCHISIQHQQHSASSVIVLSVIYAECSVFIVMLSIVMIKGTMLSVIYAECDIFYCYAACRNAECCYAECRNAE
jgi:hypothetical protein